MIPVPAEVEKNTKNAAFEISPFLYAPFSPEKLKVKKIKVSKTGPEFF